MRYDEPDKAYGTCRRNHNAGNGGDNQNKLFLQSTDICSEYGCRIFSHRQKIDLFGM